MKTVELQFPETVFSALRKDPQEFARELRLTAAVKWYEMGQISQEKAAEIAGLSRFDFLTALVRFNVSPLQFNADELVEEVKNAL